MSSIFIHSPRTSSYFTGNVINEAEVFYPPLVVVSDI